MLGLARKDCFGKLKRLRLGKRLAGNEAGNKGGTPAEEESADVPTANLPDMKNERFLYSYLFPATDQNIIIAKSSKEKIDSKESFLEDDLDKYKGKEPFFNVASLKNHVTAQSLIRGYRRRGHLVADTDPLYSLITEKGYSHSNPPPIVLRQHNFPDTEKFKFILPEHTYLSQERMLSLQDLMMNLHRAYCGTMSLDYMDDYDFNPKSYLRMNFEWPNREHMTKADHRLSIKKLLRAQALDNLVLEKYPDYWKYSMRGCETGAIIMDYIIMKGSAVGFDSFVVGMPEFGRLPFMINVMGRTPKDLFATMVGTKNRNANWYSLGCWDTFDNIYDTETNNKVSICLMQQHRGADTYYPVTLGRTKAMQWHDFDYDGYRSIAVIMHPAASVESCTTTFETTKLLKEKKSQVNGAIHVVINNQVGYTRDMRIEKAVNQCTDSFKVCRIPIIHCNARDIDSVRFAVNLAVDYKRKFGRDIVIDVLGYIEPLRDEKIRLDSWLRRRRTDQRPFLEMYKSDLADRKIMDKNESSSLEEKYKAEMNDAYAAALKDEGTSYHLWNQSSAQWLIKETEEKYPSAYPVTGVQKKLLDRIAHSLSIWPAGIDMRTEDKVELLERGFQYKKDVLDFDLCEMLAVGTLMSERVNVRISGVHVKQRVYEVTDKEDLNNKYVLLHREFPMVTCMVHHVAAHEQQNGVLGYEIGWSMCDKRQLVMFEFPRSSDKVSACQSLFFSYISCPSNDLYVKTPIVFVIPHCQGCFKDYDSAEGWPHRITMLTSESDEEIKTDMKAQLKECNMIVASISSPSQYFHFLRRQMHLPYFRPLVLYLPDCDMDVVDNFSSVEDLIDDTKAFLVIPDDEVVGSEVKKIVFCTGHIYNLLKEEQATRDPGRKVAIASIEQWHPFPFQEVKDAAGRCPNAQVCLAQVEPDGLGWWPYAMPRFALLFPDKPPAVLYQLGTAAPRAEECLRELDSLLKPVFKVD